MRARTLIKDAVKEFEAEGTRMMLLEIMDSMSLTPGGPCNSWLGGRSAIYTGLMKACLSWCICNTLCFRYPFLLVSSTKCSFSLCLSLLLVYNSHA